VTEVRVPDIGDFTDVPVIEIHVSPGDEVAVEDPLVTLESDKATMDVPAPMAGTVKQLRVQIGDRVSEGSVLVTLETDSAGPSGDGASGPSTETAAPHSETSAPSSETAGPPTGTAAPPTEASVREEPPPSPDGDGHDAQVVVLGAGVGGYSAAFRAADLGLKTILIERYERLGGVCLNVGCIPSKALLHAARVIAEVEEMSSRGITFGKPKIDLEPLIGWKQSVVDKLTGGLAGLARQRKVEVIRGVARFEGRDSLRVEERTVTFDNCIIAAGSQAATLPDLPDDPRIVDSTGALAPDELPKRLLVIGGGIIGLEMATVYDALGSKVTVVELLDQLIPGCDPDLVKPLQQRISNRYEDIRLETKVVSVEAQKSGLKVTLSDDSSASFDRILVAVGRTPNGHAIDAAAADVNVDERGFIPVDRQMRTNVPGIYAIGDIVPGPMLAHKAAHEGKVAAQVIAGQAVEFDARAIPSVAYTDPEVAWMGLSESEAKESALEYEKQVFPWAASGRALGLGRGDGLTKLLFEPDRSRLLGAGIVGVNAGDLIAETVLALEMSVDAEDIGLTVHPHPTLSETVAFAAEMAAGTITDLMPPRRRTAARA
jgi:dihydrolipoamide dehydrogenase